VLTSGRTASVRGGGHLWPYLRTAGRREKTTKPEKANTACGRATSPTPHFNIKERWKNGFLETEEKPRIKKEELSQQKREIVEVLEKKKGRCHRTNQNRTNKRQCRTKKFRGLTIATL